MSELPVGWDLRPLGEVAETQLGKMLNRSEQIGDSTIPYLRNVNVQWGRIDLSDVKEMDIYPEERSKFTAAPGDLLVCEGGESGRAAIWNGSEPIGIQNAIHRIRPKAELDVRYLLHYFEWQVKSRMIDHLLSGVTITHFTQEKLRRLEIQYPPMDEQRRIAETLDDHLSRLDKAHAEAGDAAKATMRFSASLLHSMFTGDLMQRELGIEDINVVELSEVAEIQSGGTPKGLDRLTSDVASESHTIPFYKVGDMNLDSRYMLASRAYLTSADVEKLSLKVIPVGSVIFPKAGGAIATDKKRLVKVPGPIDLNCMAVTPSSQLLPSYLAWWFESFKLSDLSNGSILPQIGKTSVMQVRLPCPSLSEQEQVVHYLEENITQVRAQAPNIDGVAASIETLRRSILNDAFSGKLVNGYSNEQ